LEIGVVGAKASIAMKEAEEEKEKKLLLRIGTMNGIRTVQINAFTTNNKLLWNMLNNALINKKDIDSNPQEKSNNAKEEEEVEIQWYHASEEMMRLRIRLEISNDDQAKDITMANESSMEIEPTLRSIHQHLNPTNSSTSPAAASSSSSVAISPVPPVTNKTTTTTTLSSSSSSSSHPPQHQQHQQIRKKVNRITLQIQSSYYDDIQSGAKQWEGRLYQPNYHGKLIPGDEILLKCRNKKELLVTIEQVQLFNGSATENGEAGEGPFEKMLNYCGLKAMLPRVESLQKGIELYRSFPNYRQKEYQRGAIAFKIVKKV
tara:strand:+ start:178 stop:1128 length:951 start_codon:yes stop_codon:yes gene_type:complete